MFTRFLRNAQDLLSRTLIFLLVFEYQAILVLGGQEIRLEISDFQLRVYSIMPFLALTRPLR